MLFFDTSRVAKTAIAALFFVFAILTFGNGPAFDALSLLIVILAAFYFRKNINVLSTLYLILFTRILGHLLFLASSNILPWKVAAYGLTLVCIIWFKNDKLRNIVGPILITTVAIEWHWYVIGYDSPEVYWSFILIGCNIAFRSALLLKPVLMSTYLNIEADFSRLDWVLHKIYGWIIIAESLNVIEYLARHTTSYSGVYYYHAYPYIMHTLIALSIFSVAHFCYQDHQLKTIKA